MTTAFADGGFFGDSLPDGASDAFRARVAQADAAYEREAQLEEHRRAQRADEAREAAVAASIVMARSRGEVFDLREALQHGRGRTPGETIEYISAMADLEDAKASAAQRRAFAEFQGSEFYGSSPNGIELEPATAARAKARQHAEAQRSQARRKGKEQLQRGEEMFDIAAGVVRMNNEDQAEAHRPQHSSRGGWRVRSGRGFGFRRAE